MLLLKTTYSMPGLLVHRVVHKTVRNGGTIPNYINVLRYGIISKIWGCVDLCSIVWFWGKTDEIFL